MHTFFINTSGKNLGEYDVLFDIYLENKTLVPLDCAVGSWYSEDKGYSAAIRKMSDMIDGYMELNNAFNLIIYIDLSEYSEYTLIKRDIFNERSRLEVSRAMHILFTHMVSTSLLKELEDSGRKPQNVLIMFGEDRKFSREGIEESEADRENIKDNILRFMGLPSDKETKAIVTGIKKEFSGSEAVEHFRKKISEISAKELLPCLRESYENELKFWFDSTVNDMSLDTAEEELFQDILQINAEERKLLNIETLSCRYDFSACKANKSIYSLCQLNVVLHVLQCVEMNSVYEDSTKKILIPFVSYTAEDISAVFREKNRIYKESAARLDTGCGSYRELSLASPPEKYDSGKFGLNEYGSKDFDLYIKTDAQTDEKTGETSERKSRTLFSEKEYRVFDTCAVIENKNILGRKATPSEYIEEAKRVSRFHTEYLSSLKKHVSHVLSNYSGNSKDNRPPLLRIGQKGYSSGAEETENLETVENLSETAYQTMINEYLEFCAGKSVAVTDISAQFDWFVTRINQIEESLKKIKYAAAGMFAALGVLYLPYIIIEFRDIFLNPAALLVFALSFSVPFMLLGLIFGILTVRQRKKYLKAWTKFKGKSDEILSKNKKSVENYDSLLSVIIPALRWTYEYKLDVDFYALCCRNAGAKIKHHREKLIERSAALENILSDLENAPDSKGLAGERLSADVTRDVDFNLPFCSGRKNTAFYSVVSKKLLDSVKETKGEQ